MTQYTQSLSQGLDEFELKSRKMSFNHEVARFALESLKVMLKK